MTLTLRAREDGDARVALVYHGKDADPKLTIDVAEPAQSPRPALTSLIPPRDDAVLDYFFHPFRYLPGTA
jgi:hypothetical protein